MNMPPDDQLQIALLRLLAAADSGQMHIDDLYLALSALFPQALSGELHAPDLLSNTPFAQRVQWAIKHLVNELWLYQPASRGGKSYVSITAPGREGLAYMESIADGLSQD